jgi:hypothetical protein
MSRIKTLAPWAHKLAMRSLLSGATLLASMALVPTVNAQIAISITPPVCVYGYYNYAPYGCAPNGFYGPGYFFNGVFLGVGPWANWGYGHGWGEHRFSGGGGGRYMAARGNGGRAYAGNRGGGAVRNGRGSSPHASASHAAAHGAPHATAHASAAHGGEHK